MHGLIAATDNMPSGSATKPGDVLRAMNGKTIEVNNTDAEGRLTLADAIAYARKEVKPHEIVDIATLTGAISIALGSLCAGAMSNDAGLQARVLGGRREGRRAPLADAPDRRVPRGPRSEVADLRNTGPRPGGAITAGLFIREFAGDTPWVHLDIAGAAFTDRDLPYAPKGGVGFGARTLLEFVLAAGAVSPSAQRPARAKAGRHRLPVGRQDRRMSGIDLHTHTIASDGTYTPAELVHEAARRGVRVLAVTDHDSVDAVAPARVAARDASADRDRGGHRDQHGRARG